MQRSKSSDYLEKEACERSVMLCSPQAPLHLKTQAWLQVTERYAEHSRSPTWLAREVTPGNWLLAGLDPSPCESRHNIMKWERLINSEAQQKLSSLHCVMHVKLSCCTLSVSLSFFGCMHQAPF